jgi:hypothetical protein
VFTPDQPPYERQLKFVCFSDNHTQHVINCAGKMSASVTLQQVVASVLVKGYGSNTELGNSNTRVKTNVAEAK